MEDCELNHRQVAGMNIKMVQMFLRHVGYRCGRFDASLRCFPGHINMVEKYASKLLTDTINSPLCSFSIRFTQTTRNVNFLTLVSGYIQKYLCNLKRYIKFHNLSIFIDTFFYFKNFITVSIDKIKYLF